MNFSDYVYNENRFSQNKNIILLNNDNSNCNYNYTYNNQNDEKIIKNNSKDTKDKIDTINHFKKISGNINGLKVDYPCPDTDSFFLKSCNDEFNLNEQNKDNNKNKINKKNIITFRNKNNNKIIINNNLNNTNKNNSNKNLYLKRKRFRRTKDKIILDFICEKCNKKYATESSLNYHYKLKHKKNVKKNND